MEVAIAAILDSISGCGCVWHHKIWPIGVVKIWIMLGQLCCSFKSEIVLVTDLGFNNVNVCVWIHLWVHYHCHCGFNYIIHKMNERAKFVRSTCLSMHLGWLGLKWWSLRPLCVPLSLFVCSWSRGIQNQWSISIIHVVIDHWTLWHIHPWGMHGGFQFHAQWMYLLWGGLWGPFIAMHCWVV